MNGTAVKTAGMAMAVLALAVLPAPAGSGSAWGQVPLPPVDGPLTRPLEPALDRVDERLGSRLERRREQLEEEAEEAAVEEGAAEAAAGTADEVVSGTVETAGQTVRQAGNAATGALGDATQGLAGGVRQVLRPFELGADPAGWPIEKDILLTLLDERQVQTATARGLDIVARRELPSLGLVMVTLRSPAGIAPGQAISEMRQALPTSVVDFNHVYRFAGQADTAPGSVGPAGGAAEADAAAVPGSLRIGMIDSAVMADHLALRESNVIGEDFVTNEGARPVGHGTAVASLIARSADNDAEIFSASVFFETPNFAPGATTASLVAALDWLASERVDVINMSLAGPGNALLERAVNALLEDGPPIVAAVGNNGPSGEPLYPAAYDDVIGVTAVDREGRVFLYANRGDHVDFAALGVNVKVADSEGTWRVESGTSMASPHVSVVVARTRGPGRLSLDPLLAALAASAEDLGRDGFDSTFGHGLITDAPVLVSRE